MFLIGLEARSNRSRMRELLSRIDSMLLYFTFTFYFVTARLEKFRKFLELVKFHVKRASPPPEDRKEV